MINKYDHKLIWYYVFLTTSETELIHAAVFRGGALKFEFQFVKASVTGREARPERSLFVPVFIQLQASFCPGG